MKSAPYAGWGIIAALMTAGIIYVIRQHAELKPLFVYLVAINLITGLLYWYDWLISPRKGPEAPTRIPNLLLLALAAVGGSLGAYIGIYEIGHKTSSKYLWLRACFWITVLLQTALVYCLFIDKTGQCQRICDALAGTNCTKLFWDFVLNL